MSDNVGNVYLGAQIDKRDLNRSLNGIASQSKGMLTKTFGGISAGIGKLGAMAAGAFAVKSIVQFGASAIQMGSDLAEVQNVVDVTFGSMSGSVSAWAQNAMTQYGLSETAAKRYTGTMGAMLKSMGVNVGAAADMSQAIAGLAGDFASFYNLDSEEAFAKIRSGISGETEPLKQLGINMSVANMEAFALKQGITQSYQSMDQASQALLRYNYLMSVSADAQGDFARTSESWANQTRVLKLQWDSFKASFGQGLINMFSPILVGINKIMSGLMKLGAMFSAFTGALFGTQKAAGGVGAQLAAIASSGEDAADGQDQAAKATKAAGKAAKGAVFGFDQLNIMQDNSSESGSGVGSALSGAGFALPELASGGEMTSPDTSKIEQAAGRVKFAWAQAGSAIKGFYTANVQPSLMQIVGWFQGTIVPGLQQSAMTLIQGWQGIFGAGIPLLKTILGDVWTSFTERIPQILGQATTTFESLNGIYQSGIETISGIATSGLEILSGLWDQYGKGILDGVWNWLLGIWDSFNQVLTLWIKPAVETVLGAVRRLWDEHLSGMFQKVGEFVAKLISAALEVYQKFIKPVTDWLIVNLAPVFRSVFDTIVGIFRVVGGIIADVVGGIMRTLGGVIDFLMGVFTGDWRRAWDGVKNIFGGIWDAIKGIFNGISDYFATVWNGIKRVFVNVINIIISGLNRFLSGVLAPLNAIIRGINRIPGVNIPTLAISIPQIPTLAQGGIVAQPTLAMVGDNRRSAEVIAPLHELTGMIRDAVGSGDGSPESLKLLSEMVGLLKVVAQKDPQIFVEKDGSFSPAAVKRANLRAGRAVYVGG